MLMKIDPENKEYVRYDPSLDNYSFHHYDFAGWKKKMTIVSVFFRVDSIC